MRFLPPTRTTRFTPPRMHAESAPILIASCDVGNGREPSRGLSTIVSAAAVAYGRPGIAGRDGNVGHEALFARASEGRPAGSGRLGMAPAAPPRGGSGLRLAPTTARRAPLPPVARVPRVDPHPVRSARDRHLGLAPARARALRRAAGGLDPRDVRPEPRSHAAGGGRSAPLPLHLRAPGLGAQVRPARAERDAAALLRAQPGPRQPALELRERGHRLDGVRSGFHVGLRERPGAVLPRSGCAPGLVRPRVRRDPVHRGDALLLHPSPAALAASLSARPRPAPPERQSRALVRALDAPARARHLPEQRPRPPGGRLASASRPLPHAVEHPGGGRLARRIRVADVPRAAPARARVVSPPAPSPLRRLQLRHTLHALRPVVRDRARRHGGSDGGDPAPQADQARRGGPPDVDRPGRGQDETSPRHFAMEPQAWASS